MSSNENEGTPPVAIWDWPGSRWWRCDLHVHSPASYDFTDRDTTSYDDLAQAASKAGLHAIAVTDHNTADGVEEVTRAGAGLAEPLAVYPGVEITTSEGAHLLVLFAPGTTADVIKGLLGACGVAAKSWGKHEAIATVGYAECVAKAADTHGALCIAAHADRPPPEDDLDSRLIYDLIVEQLKENKKRRQIVVVTHNANIVVNGDSEFIASLDFKSGHTVISESGGLQEDAMREEICAVMEGGRAAFEQRYQRIGRPSRALGANPGPRVAVAHRRKVVLCFP